VLRIEKAQPRAEKRTQEQRVVPLCTGAGSPQPLSNRNSIVTTMDYAPPMQQHPKRQVAVRKLTAAAVVLFLLIPLPAVLAQQANGELLYNGIVLPSEWPPRPDMFPVYAPPPPYLANPPSAISIDVGRQLFVDDFLVESTNLNRAHHRPTYSELNPVLFPDKPWEHGFTSPYSDGIFYDPQERVYKMWYMAGIRESTAYATSQDGIRWNKPILDVVPGTNIVVPLNGRDSNTVWLDLFETDPGKKYKMAWWYSRLNFQYSADGIHWRPIEHVSGFTGDRTSFFYNPFRSKWVISIRDGETSQELVDTRRYSRVKRYAEGATLAEAADSWPNNSDYNDIKVLPRWLSADIDDQPNRHPTFPVQLYHFDAVAYESLMLGFSSILTQESDPNDPTRPKINEVYVGYSRDGFHFSRPDRSAPFFPVSENPNAWNYGNVQTAAGGVTIVGDEIHFYVTGRRALEASVGLAVLRRDGFTSMEAGGSEGTLTTRPVTFSGTHLFVNVDAPSGQLCAEVLDQNDQVILPFSKSNCNPVHTDSTIQQITWNGAPDLSALRNTLVKFRFFLTNGKLYAFWVSPDSAGASRGYVAAGGPGFTGPSDTVGISGYQALLPDITPPVISGINATPSSVAATISWLTDEPSASQVEFPTGPCPNTLDCSTPLASQLVTDHVLSVSGLLPSTTYVYVVKSKDASGNLTTSDTQSFTTLPSVAVPPWSSQDIGAVGVAGSTSSPTAGSFTLQGAGADIWGTADAFQFVYQALTGDGQIVARVGSVQPTDGWAKAGVMIRESLLPGARNAALVVTPGNGISFQRRTQVNGISLYNAVGGGAPRWVKLVRTGASLSAYSSLDGISWTLTGTETIALPTTVYVGLAVTSHTYGVLTTAVFDHLSVP